MSGEGARERVLARSKDQCFRRDSSGESRLECQGLFELRFDWTTRSWSSIPKLTSCTIDLPARTRRRERVSEYSFSTTWTCDWRRSAPAGPSRPRAAMRERASGGEREPHLRRARAAASSSRRGGRARRRRGTTPRRARRRRRGSRRSPSGSRRRSSPPRPSPGNSPTILWFRCSPIRKAAPAAPWSVPFESFCAARRPNSLQRRVTHARAEVPLLEILPGRRRAPARSA